MKAGELLFAIDDYQSNDRLHADIRVGRLEEVNPAQQLMHFNGRSFSTDVRTSRCQIAQLMEQ